MATKTRSPRRKLNTSDVHRGGRLKATHSALAINIVTPPAMPGVSIALGRRNSSTFAFSNLRLPDQGTNPRRVLLGEHVHLVQGRVRGHQPAGDHREGRAGGRVLVEQERAFLPDAELAGAGTG